MRHKDPYLPGAGFIVFLAASLLFLPWLGETLFYSKGEPREALVAVALLDSDNWILPLFYGSDIPYKPPFLAWLIAICAKVFNGGHVNEYIARLPSALAVISMTMAGYSWARKLNGLRFAMIYAFVTMCSFEVCRAGMACRLDMVLTALMVIPLYVMYNLHENGTRERFRPLKWLAVWLMLSCATLTKGPVGALLPCFAFGIYCLLRRDNFWLSLVKMLGLAVSALILPGLWYCAALKQGGQPFADLMYEEVLGRLFGTMSYESHVQPFWYNFVTLISGLLPWTVMLLLGAATYRRYRRAPLKTPGLYCATIAATIVLFYCIPESKRSVYLLPAYPFITYGIACLFADENSKRISVVFSWIMAVIAVVAPVVFLVAYLSGDPRIPLGAMPWWGYITLTLCALTGIAWMYNRHTPVGHTMVIVWMIWVAYASAVMPAVLNPLSDKKLLPRLDQSPTETVYSYANGDKFYRCYSLDFYLNDKMRHIDSSSRLTALPEGTLVVLPADTDTTGLHTNFNFEPLTERSADFRNRLMLAVRK